MDDDKNISFSKGGVEPGDDNDIKMPEKGAEPAEATDLDDVGPGRVYDFTEDLNIAPAKDADVESTRVPRPSVAPVKPFVAPIPNPRAAPTPKPQPIIPIIKLPLQPQSKAAPVKASAPVTPPTSPMIKPQPQLRSEPVKKNVFVSAYVPPVIKPQPQVQAPKTVPVVVPQKPQLPVIKPVPMVTRPVLTTPPPTSAASTPFPEEKRLAQNVSSAPFQNKAALVPTNKSFPVTPIPARPTTPFQDKPKSPIESWLTKAQPQAQTTPFPADVQKTSDPIATSSPLLIKTAPTAAPGLIPSRSVSTVRQVPTKPAMPTPKVTTPSSQVPKPPQTPNPALPIQAKNVSSVGNYREPLDVPAPPPVSAVPRPLRSEGSAALPEKTGPVNVPANSAPRVIPVKDFSIPNQKNKTAPSNPRAKTISLETSDTGETDDTGTLQGTIGAIISRDGKTAQSSNTANPNVKNLRTYEGDVADILSQRNVSTATMVMAENKKEEAEGQIRPVNQPEKSRSLLKLLAVLISLTLIGGGVFTAYYLYSQSPLGSSAQSAPAGQTATVISSLVPADSQVLVPIDDLTPLNIKLRFETELSKTQPPDTIEEIVPTETAGGQSVRVAGPDMLAAMNITPPDILVRSLTAAWMLGIYTDDAGTKTVFVVATTNFFQNAFAGMLAWESVMADDLKQYIYPAGIAGIANAPPAPTVLDVVNPVAATSSKGTATSTSGNIHPASASTTPAASSTPIINDSIQPYATVRGQFSDHIIDNKDVREFRTNAGDLLFLYSFINNGELVFTTRESALSAIISRLEKQVFTR